MSKSHIRLLAVSIFVSAILFAVPTFAVMYIPTYMGKVTAKNSQDQTIEILVIDGVDTCGTDKIGETLTVVPRSGHAFGSLEIGDYVLASGGGEIWYTVAKLKSKTEKVITDLYGDLGFGSLCSPFSDGFSFMGNYTLEYSYTPNCSTHQMEDPKITITEAGGDSHTQELTPGVSSKYTGSQHVIDITFESGSTSASDCGLVGPQPISNFTIEIRNSGCSPVDPPSVHRVGSCDQSCQQGAPVKAGSQALDVCMNYSGPVTALVGIMTQDFSTAQWLRADDCSFSDNFQIAMDGSQYLDCSNVQVSEPFRQGWVFWLVTVENFSSLDWENGIYELLFYQWDFAEGNSTGMEVIRSEQQRNSSPDVPEADLTELVAGNSDFAFDLYQEVRQKAGNLFYSPHSISLALAMTYAGARNETESQMADTLHFSLTQAHLHPAFNALDLELASRGQGAEGQDGKGFRLNIVNSIWGQTGYSFLSGFLDVLAENYGAGLRLLDFQNAPEDSRVCINNWVSDQTEDRINDLIPQDSITSLTRLVLTNAIYFNAAWLYPFDEELTQQDGTFHLPGGSQITVPMMSQIEYFRYASGYGYQAVELPYDGKELSMVVFLPEAGRFEEFEASLDAGRVETIINNFSSTYLHLTMPKFEYKFSLGRLKDMLKAMGMKDAFNLVVADFSGMTGKRSLYISDVIHKAFVSVDEAGTEAAAATAVIMPPIGMPPTPTELTLDHPFIFLIRDIKTGAILFVGRVLNPGQ